jgi:hypothetical protein
MSQNFTNTSTAKVNAFNKGMVKDYTDIYISEGLWTNAVNAINNAHYGETGSIGNEPSNKFCTDATYDIIGFAHIGETTWVVFSTNDVSSEIGVFDEKDCSYKKTVNDPCLGFRKTHLISAVVKGNYDCTDSVYFADGLNPDRVLNLNNVPYKTTGNNLSQDPDCFVPEYTNQLDCDALRLHPLVTQPCVTVRKAQGSGQLNNGSYMAVVAYSENGIRLTDYSIPSQPQALWDHTGIGGALDITIENLDQDFEEYELVIIAVINQQTIAKRIGYYSIRQKNVSLDIYNQSLPTVELALIPLKSVVYEVSEKMHSVNDYLIRTGVTTQPYFNYQQQANDINVQWVAAEYPSDYYYGGGNVTGYMRDEVYAFFIRWVYKTGARSASFHIPGRVATASDTAAVSGPDVVYPTETQAWQVYDTSSKYLASGTATDGGAIIAKGDMAYWESTEEYPDDKPEVWGTLCGKKIRHHKMPSNETIHIHNQGGDRIINLGVEFSNIQHPVDENLVPIADIVGYEILRGSREGNRSIVAKGLFNNMFEFDIQGSNRKGLFQNYPYNDVRPDGFLTNDFSVLDEGKGSQNGVESASKLNTHKKNYFSFHSVETNFVKPYLGSNYVKIYTEERGNVVGKFEYPYKHPKHVLITDGAFITAGVVGLGIALVASVGKTTLTSEIAPWVLALGSGGYYGGTQVTRESGAASVIGDYIAFGATSGASGFGAGNLASQIAGVAVMIASGAYYWGQGTDQALDIFRKLGKDRQYMLQYNSRGFYDSYSNVSNSSVPSGYAQAFRRKVASSGSKYIGSGIHDFDATYRINNLNRNKYVAVKTTTDLPNPASTTDNTKHRVQDGGVNRSNPSSSTVQSNTVAYYGALKVDFQNQYGQLTSIVQLPTDSCIYSTEPQIATPYSTSSIFGGDVYINRYTEKNPFMFFNTWMYDMPTGTEYDYRNYVNGPVPRYWINFDKFDVTDFNVSISLSSGVNFTTPSDFHRMDRAGGTGTFTLRNCFAYLFHNGIRDFYTESELNMAFRDYGEEDFQKFYDVYGNSFNDEQTMFRSDLITKPIYNKYDLSLSTSKLFNNFATWGQILPRDYDPTLYTTCFEYYPKRAVYSLPQQSGLKRDNWRNFLPLNYKDFGGKISTIKSLNATGAIILFEDAEPVQFVGVDQLQTKGGVKVTIGDGGLFQQNMQSLANADDTIEYAACISSRSAVNTPFGLFYASQKSGKVMHYSGGLDEISRNGMKFWFAENLPSKLLRAYPDYPLYDNPVAGIGVQAMYDPQYELVYFTKKDYIPLRDDLLFDDPSGVPYYICGNTFEPVEELVCEKIPVTEISTTGLNSDGTLTINWEHPSVTALQENPQQYLIQVRLGVYDDIMLRYTYSTLMTSQTVNYPTNSYVIPATLNYFTGSEPQEHTLNLDSHYSITVTPVYSCGETGPATLEGTISSFETMAAMALFALAPDSGCKAPLDLAFVLDITGSMGATLNNLKTSISAIAADAAVKSDNDYRLALITVDEISTGPVNVIRQSFSQNNLTSFQVAINAVTLGGGNNLPEPTDLGIESVLNGQLGAFRSNAIKMIVMITDALPSGGNDQYTVGVDNVKVQVLANTAASQGVRIYPIATGVGVTGPSASTIAALHNTYATISGGIANVSETGIVSNIIGDEILNVPCPVDCEFSADNLSIVQGDPLVLTWTTTGASSVSIDQGVGNVATSGSTTVYPAVNTTYILTATNGTNTSTCEVSVEVTPLEMECTITSNLSTINRGDEVVISWNVTGNPTTVTLMPGNTVVSAIGNITVTPTATTTYMLIIERNGLTDVCEVTVVVNQPSTIKCPCEYDNPKCFEPCNWTVSYDPKQKLWISFHDWHPELLMSSHEHFYTIKGKGIWKHNSRWDSYANYYGQDYPWEIEYPIVTPNNITTLRSVEYTLDVYKFFNDGKDFNHILDENFDRAIVHNSEQMSGLLRLKLKGKNNPLDLVNYPQISPNGIDILYSKEENKFRFNQFWDITKDRGEFTGNDDPMWITKCSGYQRTINPDYVNYFKTPTEHKKFRHYGNKIILRKNVSGDKKMILKLTNSKHLNSSR